MVYSTRHGTHSAHSLGTTILFLLFSVISLSDVTRGTPVVVIVQLTPMRAVTCGTDDALRVVAVQRTGMVRDQMRAQVPSTSAFGATKRLRDRVIIVTTATIAGFAVHLCNMKCGSRGESVKANALCIQQRTQRG